MVNITQTDADAAVAMRNQQLRHLPRLDIGNHSLEIFVEWPESHSVETHVRYLGALEIMTKPAV